MYKHPALTQYPHLTGYKANSTDVATRFTTSALSGIHSVVRVVPDFDTTGSMWHVRNDGADFHQMESRRDLRAGASNDFAEPGRT